MYIYIYVYELIKGEYEIEFGIECWDIFGKSQASSSWILIVPIKKGTNHQSSAI